MQVVVANQVQKNVRAKNIKGKKNMLKWIGKKIQG